MIELEQALKRLLVIAPHPDDEVIGSSALIQRALASGGAVRVVVLTSGEHNSWPQRVMFRRWRITNDDRAEWARIRLSETAAALSRMGAPNDAVVSLGFPDTDLSRLARDNDRRLINAVCEQVSLFQPTLVVTSSWFDAHADHSAAAYAAHTAVRRCSAIEPAVLTYVVHGKPPAHRISVVLELTDKERRRKRDAIECHESQLLLSRKRFLEFADRDEVFCRDEFDVVRQPRWLREKLTTLRHVMRAIAGIGRSHLRPRSHVQPAADVHHGTGDV